MNVVWVVDPDDFSIRPGFEKDYGDGRVLVHTIQQDGQLGPVRYGKGLYVFRTLADALADVGRKILSVQNELCPDAAVDIGLAVTNEASLRSAEKPRCFTSNRGFPWVNAIFPREQRRCCERVVNAVMSYMDYQRLGTVEVRFEPINELEDCMSLRLILTDKDAAAGVSP